VAVTDEILVREEIASPKEEVQVASLNRGITGMDGKKDQNAKIQQQIERAKKEQGNQEDGCCQSNCTIF